MKVSAHVERHSGQVMGMVLWLVMGLAVAILNALAGATGFRGIALSWGLHPGWLIILLIMIGCLAGLRTMKLGPVLSIGILLAISTVVEFLGFSRETSSLFGISLVLLAEVLVVRATPNNNSLRAVWFVFGKLYTLRFSLQLATSESENAVFCTRVDRID